MDKKLIGLSLCDFRPYSKAKAGLIPLVTLLPPSGRQRRSDLPVKGKEFKLILEQGCPWQQKLRAAELQRV